MERALPTEQQTLICRAFGPTIAAGNPAEFPQPNVARDDSIGPATFKPGNWARSER
jgi:hypothetical protein